MKKSVITLTILLFTAFVSFSQIETDTTKAANQQTVIDTTQAVAPPVKQEKQEKPKKQKQNKGNKIYFGGSIGFMFGNYTRISLYPVLGYKFTPKLSGGVKVYYEYVKDKRYASTYESSSYGGGLFARYRIIPQLYIHAEFAEINYDIWNPNLQEAGRIWVPFLYLGAGFSQRMGGNAWLNAQILFDVLQDPNSPYGSWEPIYSIGVGVGF